MSSPEQLRVQCSGARNQPVLIYMPGLHGDWTLMASFRTLARERFYFIEITYPRTIHWTLDDYASQTIKLLGHQGIQSGIILAESFSSQVAWSMVKAGYQIEGIVLAGGFGKHPFPGSVKFAAWLMRVTPASGWKIGFALYAAYSGFRHRNAPETKEGIKQFMARRTPEDIRAMRARLNLILQNDPAEIIQSFKGPIFALSGFVDPIVPWFIVIPRLKKLCPSLVGSKLIYSADHTVLATAPAQSFATVLDCVKLFAQAKSSACNLESTK